MDCFGFGKNRRDKFCTFKLTTNRIKKEKPIKTIHPSLEIEGNTLTLEQITAIIENKRVIGPKKDIPEVKNAIAVYNHLYNLNPYKFESFCEAHGKLMNGLTESAGMWTVKNDYFTRKIIFKDF